MMEERGMKRISPIVCVLALMACAPDGLGRPNPGLHIIAHRGAPRNAAENTIRSFEVSAAFGANALETDVVMTEDEELVLWHDRDPDTLVTTIRRLGLEGNLHSPLLPPRGSTFRRPVEELTLAELREHYGYQGPDGALDPDAPIAHFDELLTWTESSDSMDAIYLDCKFESTNIRAAEKLFEAVLAFQEASGTNTRFYLLSVYPEIIRAWQAVSAGRERNDIRLVLDVEGFGALEQTLELGLRDISTGLIITEGYTDFRRELVEIIEARERGEIDSVTVWTFNTEWQLAELLYYSVDGIMTDESSILFGMWQDTLDPG